MIGTLFLILPYPKIIAATAHFQMVLYSVNEKKVSAVKALFHLTFRFSFGRIIHTLIPNSNIQNVLCL